MAVGSSFIVTRPALLLSRGRNRPAKQPLLERRRPVGTLEQIASPAVQPPPKQPSQSSSSWRYRTDHGLLFPYRIGEELPTIRELSRSDSNGDNLIRPEFAPRAKAHFFFNSASQFSTTVSGWISPFLT